MSGINIESLETAIYIVDKTAERLKAIGLLMSAANAHKVFSIKGAGICLSDYSEELESAYEHLRHIKREIAQESIGVTQTVISA